MDNSTVKIGLAGFGTVGTGTAKILLEQAKAIKQRTGIEPALACVVDIDTHRPRTVTLPDGVLTNDLNRLLNDKSIPIGVELVGGTTTAMDIVLKMLAAGKDVVTANKALLAEHGSELFRAAKAAGRCIAFEGSCAGGIPIISAIRTGLAANEITAIYGILNGTCNYILSSMSEQGGDFSASLKQAQARGYAEADSTLDINGHDSAHKLAILGRLAFGCEIKLDDVFVEGIENIDIQDIKNGQEMGYILKLLAIGEKTAGGGISLRVHPSFISKKTALAHVNGPFNAISVFATAVGNTMYYGRGAGMMPTASAVVADIIEIARGNSQKLFRNIPLESARERGLAVNDIGGINSRFYIRLLAKDRPGVVATYGRILGEHNISISGASQHEGTGPDNSVPVIVLTHPTKQVNMSAALEEMSESDVISGMPVCLRIVDIPEDRDDG